LKAAYRKTYGSPSVLEIKDLPNPKPKDNELLISVKATTVNRTDCGILTGKPFIIRFFTGLFSPKKNITGTDFAGVVESVGTSVNNFKPGDRVWGFHDKGLRSHASMTVLKEEKHILKIPEHFSFEDAAASAEGAHYAYNFINKVIITSGQKVLVNGATGAIGSAAVQILRSLNVEVTAVCKSEHFSIVKGIGADSLIDYQLEDFTTLDEKFDFVFDAVGKSSFLKCKKILKPKGIYISSELGPYSQNIYLPLITSITGGKKVIFPVPTNIPKSLSFIQSLIEGGNFKPLVDKIYPVEKIEEAFEYVLTGEKIGNVILQFK